MGERGAGVNKKSLEINIDESETVLRRLKEVESFECETEKHFLSLLDFKASCYFQFTRAFLKQLPWLTNQDKP